jgi:hypothetical protein
MHLTKSNQNLIKIKKDSKKICLQHTQTQKDTQSTMMALVTHLKLDLSNRCLPLKECSNKEFRLNKCSSNLKLQLDHSLQLLMCFQPQYNNKFRDQFNLLNKELSLSSKCNQEQ